jgi:hypothetical protein
LFVIFRSRGMHKCISRFSIALEWIVNSICDHQISNWCREIKYNYLLNRTSASNVIHIHVFREIELKYPIIWWEIIHIRVFRQIELKCLILWCNNPHYNVTRIFIGYREQRIGYFNSIWRKTWMWINMRQAQPV